LGAIALHPAPFNPRDFRNALGRFASGVTVITVHREEHTHGMTANAFVSVSLDPPLVLVSLDNRSNMHRLLPEVRRYGVSVLAENQENLSNHFAGKPAPEVEAGFTMRDGIPLLDGAVAHFIVEVTEVHPAGDHTLYLGRVAHFEWRDGRPLLFYAGRYQQLRAQKPAEWGEHEFSLFSIGGFDPKSIK
jgi:flavin reductase (DIM6/NTAB) family NADH-FMN oxidoreductase RutF